VPELAEIGGWAPADDAGKRFLGDNLALNSLFVLRCSLFILYIIIFLSLSSIEFFESLFIFITAAQFKGLCTLQFV